MKCLITALLLLFSSYVLATEGDPLSVELYISRAESNIEKGEFFKALENYQVVIDKGVSSPDINQKMSALYYHLGFLDKAIKATEETIKGAPLNYYLHHNLGVFYFVKNHLDKAQEHFIKALEINPGSTNSHYYLAHVFLRQGLPETARIFAYSARQLGHPASDILESSDNESQSLPPSVWVNNDSKIYLRQIFVKERKRSEEIMDRLKEGVLFEDIARREFDNPNGGYFGGYPLEDLQDRVVSSLSNKVIPSLPIVVESKKKFIIIQKIAPIDWKRIASMHDSYSLEELQTGSQEPMPVTDVESDEIKPQSPLKQKGSLYSVQIGVFREYKYAQQEIEKINTLGYEGYLVKILKPDRPVYVAFAGNYPNHYSAEIVSSKLIKNGFDAFITKRKID